VLCKTNRKKGARQIFEKYLREKEESGLAPSLSSIGFKNILSKRSHPIFMAQGSPQAS